MISTIIFSERKFVWNSSKSCCWFCKVWPQHFILLVQIFREKFCFASTKKMFFDIPDLPCCNIFYYLDILYIFVIISSFTETPGCRILFTNIFVALCFQHFSLWWQPRFRTRKMTVKSHRNVMNACINWMWQQYFRIWAKWSTFYF